MDPSPAPPPLSLGQLLYERTPRVIVTPAIIAVDAALFAAMIATSGEAAFTSETLVSWGAQFAPAIAAGEWWRLLTAMWLHGHPPHLILNALVLWQLGGIVERLLGPLVFLIVYVLTGVLAAIASLEYHGATGLSVGASGAIFGVAGVLLAVAFTGRGRMMTDLRGSMISFVIYNAMAGFVLPRVDNAAHFGGLAGGVVIGWLVARRSLQARPRLIQTLIPIAMTLALAAGEQARASGRQSVESELARYDVVLDRADRMFRQGVADVRTKRRTPGDLAGAIEREVLPELAVMRQRADGLLRESTRRVAEAERKDPYGRMVDWRHLPGFRYDLELARAWAAYLAGRDQAWRLRARGLREGRDDLLQQARQFEQASSMAFARVMAQPRPQNPTR